MYMVGIQEDEFLKQREHILSIIYYYTRKNSVFDKKSRLKNALVIIDGKIEDSPYTFSKGKYTPEVHGMDETIEKLKESGLIESGVSEEQDCTYEWYKLTESGTEKIEKELESMESDRRDLYKWVVERHVDREMGALLSFCYLQRPELYM